MPVCKAVGDEFGCCLVPELVDLKPYYGKVDGWFCAQLAAGVSWELQGIWVVKYGCPLFLLGADVMRGGTCRAGTSRAFAPTPLGRG